MENSRRVQQIATNVKGSNHVGIATIGWVVGLIIAAMFMPRPDFGSHPSLVIKGVFVIIAVWTAYTAVAVPLYLCRAWYRLRTVPNKTDYALWLGFETLCAFAVTLSGTLFCGIRRSECNRLVSSTESLGSVTPVTR